MQDGQNLVKLDDLLGFSILIGSGGDASCLPRTRKHYQSRFSILIGSGGDASKCHIHHTLELNEFQYPHRIGW